MALDPADLNTETFTNSRGWTLVRVTHVPTGVSAERERTRDRDSPVGAQAECIDELKVALATRQGTEPPPSDSERSPVSRAEFEALEARVRELERRAT